MATTSTFTATDTSPSGGQAAAESTQNMSIAASSAAPVRKTRELSKYKHIFPIHRVNRQSCLTTGASPAPNYTGFRNLMVLIVITSNLRLMIENFQKYGVLICISCHDYRRQDVVLGSLLFLLVPSHLFVAFLIERVAAWQASSALSLAKKNDQLPPLHPQRRRDPADAERHARSVWSQWHTIALFHFLNSTISLALATWTVYYQIHHPGIGTICELHAVIVWLKTCSYALTNRDLRHAYLSGSDLAVEGAKPNLPELYNTALYPKNVSISNLSYFWWAPTLIYQPVYPRTDSIRPMFCLKRLLEVVSLSIAIWIASAQYAVPVLRNSLPVMASLSPVEILERLMKLSSISLFCWLAGFFALFQSFLNLLAELMRFGDREFYGDWWNSPDLRTYWSSWNKPVYHFMKRHIYMPMIGRGVHPLVAQIGVFFFSGVLHEIIVGVPTHSVIGVAFAGMAFQLPLIIFTDALRKTRLFHGPTAGNVVFWVSFVLVGQPLAALLYFFAWHARFGSVN